MSGMNSLRHRVARSIFTEGRAELIPRWAEISPARRKPWLEDADRVILIVLESCSGLADQRDPEKPDNYLFKRENIGSAMRGLFIGWPSDDCPEELDD